MPIDPYLMGYWLGNGSSTSREITVRDGDVEAVRAQIPYEIQSEIVQPGSRRLRIPALKPVLLDSFRDKVIPPEYLRASEAQRWALLQGLMDSDGCISTVKAQSIYVSTIRPLAESVRELLWSLGIKNAMTAGPSLRYGKPTGETLYTIRFTTFDDQPTSRLKRKYDRKRERKKKTRSCFHYLQNIEPLPYKVKMRCIQVDSSSHQYLAGPSMVPTHNSELGAAIALNMLVNDDEWKAEVYSCASDRQQAAIVFDVAVDMVKQSPALMKRIKIIPSMKRMVYQPTGSIYQVLSSEVATKHGLNVSACIFDELHTQPTRALYDVMTQGSGDARKQPLWFFLTTAGTDRNSICWEVHQKALDILEGRKRDPRFYPVIFGLRTKKTGRMKGTGTGPTHRWGTPSPSTKCATPTARRWRRPPMRTCSVSLGSISGSSNPCAGCPWTSGTSAAARSIPTNWKAGLLWGPRPFLDERPDHAGAGIPAEDGDGVYTVLPFFWLPEDTLPLRVRRDHVMYDVWKKQGFIQTTEGNVVHYGFIQQFICQLGERYNIREIAYDRWNATMMVQALEDDGFTMIPFGQGFKDMSPPTKELMRLVLERHVNHGGHPVLRWNMDNAFVRTDPAGNLKIDKEKSTEKVDGAVALVMALDRAMKKPGRR